MACLASAHHRTIHTGPLRRLARSCGARAQLRRDSSRWADDRQLADLVTDLSERDPDFAEMGDTRYRAPRIGLEDPAPPSGGDARPRLGDPGLRPRSRPPDRPVDRGSRLSDTRSAPPARSAVEARHRNLGENPPLILTARMRHNLSRRFGTMRDRAPLDGPLRYCVNAKQRERRSRRPRRR